MPPGSRPSVDCGRGHHLVRREAHVRARSRREPPSAVSRCRSARASCAPSTASTACSRLHADIDNIKDEDFTVPAIIFDRLPEDHVVQMFVTINAKHTRLNASHLVSLSGRQLYRDDALAAAHDVVRALNDREDSPLARRDQAARRRSRPSGAGADCAGTEEAVRQRRVRRAAEVRGFPRRLEEVLRELLQAGVGGVRRGVERTEVQHQVGNGSAGVHSRRAGCRAAAGPGTRRSQRFSGNWPCHRAMGSSHRRLSDSRARARGSAPARRSNRWRVN